jgi:N-acetylglutamate synthase-like GNAT family acetyltransferase
MAGSYEIRTAHSGDAAQIARLSEELGHPVSLEEMGRRLQRLLASVADTVIVAAGEDGLLLGWVAVTSRIALQSGAKAEISGLVVGAAARRRGVGRALVAASSDWAAGCGFESIAVRSNIRRSESHPFYGSLGFSLQKTQHFYRKCVG